MNVQNNIIMDGLNEDLAFKILTYFQGSRQRRIIKHSREYTDFDFQKILFQSRKKLGKIETDVKTIIALAETNRFFFDLIRKSEYGRFIWVIYYNSLFPEQINLDSVHIGPVTWRKCGVGSFPGVGNIDVPQPEARCNDPIHYTNNEKRSGHNWSIDALFKRISIRNFVMMKNEGTYFNRLHQDRLDNLKNDLYNIYDEIQKLEQRKRVSSLDLSRIYEPWISEKQAKSYYLQKNQDTRINEETITS